MQTQPKIDFQGLKATPEMKAAIEERVAELEERWGRITACRVMIKAPSQHHRTSGLYEIHIHLSLPDGREVNVTRTPIANERHADVTFALNDAFKHARRQLQDRVRRAQGQVKYHEAAAIGKVIRIDPAGEFGFLESSEGQGIYFHRNSVVEGGCPFPRGFAGDLYGEDWRKGCAGEHREAPAQAQPEDLGRRRRFQPTD